jgi:hypothetical protein
MVDDSFPNITSFMIRFIEEGPTDSAGEPVYRGFIRHIQTDKEIVFTRWQDAMTFMEKYVSIERISNHGK